SRREVYVAKIVLTETYYVVCRLSGRGVARDLLTSLRESGVIEVVGDDSLDVRAGDIKCARSISISDCYVIALAELVRGAAVFAKRERELEQELEREPFGVDIVFLDDYLKRKPHG
ncbi:MAG TPA: type II toxin-antitoxin system VapC family toxin, partial [Candidatus Korarchaeota archaeon]|nr:type II toxin-antitoxin system VapC family toxin [Candidatus Korarchaeota archaeon]